MNSIIQSKNDNGILIDIAATLNEYLSQDLMNFKPLKINNKHDLISSHYYKKGNTIQQLNNKSLIRTFDRDSLYFTRLRKSQVKVIYITPHITTHETGKLESDVILEGSACTELFNGIVLKFTYRMRLLDGQVMEVFNGSTPFFDPMQPLLSNFEGMFIKSTKECINFLQTFSKHVEELSNIFIKTQFIPYLLHPTRMVVLLENKVSQPHLELISSNLFHYIYSPILESLRLKDILFFPSPFAIYIRKV